MSCISIEFRQKQFKLWEKSRHIPNTIRMEFSFFRKWIAGSLAFLIAASNLSFLAVNIPTAYATVLQYDPNLNYGSGSSFVFNNKTVLVSGTGAGTVPGDFFPGCTEPDIAVWSGASVQIWSACNVGATSAFGTGSYHQWHRDEDVTSSSATGALANVGSGSTFAGHSEFIV